MNKIIIITGLFIIYSSANAQVDEVFPTKTDAVEILLKDVNIRDLAVLIEDFQNLEHKLDIANGNIIKLSKLFISSEVKVKLQLKIDSLRTQIDRLVMRLSSKQVQIIALHESLKREVKLANDFERLNRKYRFDFEKLKRENYKQHSKSFFNNIKYRIEVVTQNLMKVDQHIQFCKRGIIIKQYGEKIEPRTYTDIQLENCTYRIPSYLDDEVDFEKECVFLVYNEKGNMIQSITVEFEEDMNSTNPYTKTYRIKNDVEKNTKSIKLNKRIRSNKINIYKYKFLVIEESIYNENIRKFKSYNKAINEKIILSNDLEIVSKSLDNLLQLLNCTYSQELIVKHQKVRVEIFDTVKEDNDRILFFSGLNKYSDEITLKQQPVNRFVNVEYFTTLRFTPSNTGNGQDQCTIGITIEDNEPFTYKLKYYDSVCIELIAN